MPTITADDGCALNVEVSGRGYRRAIDLGNECEGVRFGSRCRVCQLRLVGFVLLFRG